MARKLRDPWTRWVKAVRDATAHDAYATYSYQRGGTVPALVQPYDPELPYEGDGRVWRWIASEPPVKILGTPRHSKIWVEAGGEDYLAYLVDLTEIPSKPERRTGDRREASALDVLAIAFSDIRGYNGDDEAYQRGWTALRAMRHDNRKGERRGRDAG